MMENDKLITLFMHPFLGMFIIKRYDTLSKLKPVIKKIHKMDTFIKLKTDVLYTYLRGEYHLCYALIVQIITLSNLQKWTKKQQKSEPKQLF